MEKLEEALREALSRNAAETARWTGYKDEQETAITNLKQFAEKLSIDVMVPVGSKAFMPGQLYHTNEILVSHYRGFFSKCSSKQAQELAKHRILSAKERLECLKKEQEMYKNKLEKPFVDGALPSDQQQEIIEEYDEETEKKWRIEHQKKVRDEKLREAREISDTRKEKTHEDVMNILDDLEIMDELEQELDALQVEDDETLKKLMSGEIQLPAERSRFSQCQNKSIVIGSNVTENETNIEIDVSVIDAISERLKSGNIANSSSETVDFTNNNTEPNSVDYGSDEESGSTSSEDLPQLLLDIEDEAKELSPGEKLKFFKKKIKGIGKELQNLTVKSVDDITAKINKIEVRDYLYDYIEILKDEIENEIPEKSKREVKHPAEAKKAKRITFAKEDEVQFIDKNKAANTVTRSKIELSDDSYSMLNLKTPKTASDTPPFPLTMPQTPVINKRDEIVQKVEKSLEYVSTNQSQNDFNLIDKIIESTSSPTRTMSIHVSHSHEHFVRPGYDTTSHKDNTIGSPADIYEAYKHLFPTEFQSKITTNQEMLFQCDEKICETASTVQTSHVGNKNRADVASDVNRHIGKVKVEKTNKDKKENYKSILKNRDKVRPEERNVNPIAKSAKTNGKKKKESQDGGYELIIGDVVENARTTNTLLEKETVMTNEMNEPDPLPDEHFVDAVAPKKRISRFKQMRTNI